MTNQIRNPNDEGVFGRFIALITISLGTSAACWWAAGNSLGLFFGGLFVITFLVPAGVLGLRNLRQSILGLAAVIGPVAIFWLIPVLKGVDTPRQWAEAVFVLLMYAVAVAGIALILVRMMLPVIFAAAVAVVVSLAWLTWPVWLSAMLVKSGQSRVIQNLVAVHPPLVINGILTNEPAWTERSLAYHLTVLNQDVPIKLPENAGASVTMHGIVGLVLWSAAFLCQRKAVEPRHFENRVNPA